MQMKTPKLLFRKKVLQNQYQQALQRFKNSCDYVTYSQEEEGSLNVSSLD